MSPDFSIRSFQAALNALYGDFYLEPTDDMASAQGSILGRSCRAFELTEVEARKLISRRNALSLNLRDRVYLFCCLEGHITVEQYNLSSSLAAGDFLLLDSAAGCTITTPSYSRVQTLEISRNLFLNPTHEIDSFCGIKIPSSSGPAKLIAGIIMSLSCHRTHFLEKDSRMIQELTAKLVIEYFCETRQSDPHPRALDSLERIRRLILCNIDNNKLNPEFMADQLGLSRRNLYRIFKQMGTTPGKWLWQLRLEQARKLMMNSSNGNLSISTIAFQTGFNDSGHFSKLFKKHYGTSPKEFRKGHQI